VRTLNFKLILFFFHYGLTDYKITVELKSFNNMEELKFNDIQKKTRNIGFKVSEYEREQLEAFCQRQQITITDFLRYAIRLVINKMEK